MADQPLVPFSQGQMDSYAHNDFLEEDVMVSPFEIGVFRP